MGTQMPGSFKTPTAESNSDSDEPLTMALRPRLRARLEDGQILPTRPHPRPRSQPSQLTPTTPRTPLPNSPIIPSMPSTPVLGPVEHALRLPPAPDYGLGPRNSPIIRSNTPTTGLPSAVASHPRAHLYMGVLADTEFATLEEYQAAQRDRQRRNPALAQLGRTLRRFRRSSRGEPMRVSAIRRTSGMEMQRAGTQRAEVEADDGWVHVERPEEPQSENSLVFVSRACA